MASDAEPVGGRRVGVSGGGTGVGRSARRIRPRIGAKPATTASATSPPSTAATSACNEPRANSSSSFAVSGGTSWPASASAWPRISPETASDAKASRVSRSARLTFADQAPDAGRRPEGSERASSARTTCAG